MDLELSRRNFLKGTGAIAALGAVAAMGVGCSPAADSGTDAAAEAATAPKSPVETTYATASEPTDGKYVTKAMGHENWVFVETTVTGESTRRPARALARRDRGCGQPRLQHVARQGS